MNFLIIFMIRNFWERQIYVEGLKKMEGGAGNMVNDGMGPKVRWEEKHNISVQQAIQAIPSCMGYLLKPTPLIWNL